MGRPRAASWWRSVMNLPCRFATSVSASRLMTCATSTRESLRMPSFRPDNDGVHKQLAANEPRDFTQLGLDFSCMSEYINVPRKEIEIMNHELLEALENKVNDLLEKYRALQEENNRLAEENHRIQSEREGLKSRVDAILGKLDGI